MLIDPRRSWQGEWKIAAMRIYWSLKSIPELSGLPPLARARAWFCCVHKTYRHWQTWLGFVSFLAASFVLILVLPVLVFRFRLSFAFAIVIMVVILAPILTWFGHVQSKMIRPYLREYFQSQSTKSENKTSKKPV